MPNKLFLSPNKLMSEPLTQPYNPTHSSAPYVISVIGGNKVGKTTLSRNLSEATTITESSNQNCNIFCKEFTQKGRIIHYYDHSALSLKLIDDLPVESPQMILALFRDSVSYGQLYEFFENVTARTEDGSQQLKAFWEDFENLVLVYSEVEGQKEVQIDQLFGILIEEIRNFNRTATIKQFVLKRDPDNHQYLRQLIEKTLQSFEVEAQTSEALEKREDEVKVEEERQSTKHVVEIDHAGEQQKIAEQIEISVEMNKIFQQQIKEEEKVSLQVSTDPLPQQQIDKSNVALQESTAQHTPLSIFPEPIVHHSIPREPSNQHQTISVEVQSKHLQDCSSRQENEEGQPVQQHDEQQLAQIQKAIQLEVQVLEVGTIQKQEEDLPQLQLAAQCQTILPIQKEVAAQRVQQQQIDKEQQHYIEVYNRLMQKISSEEIQDARKDSYKNLFEEFRRTSKEESKISKELHQYWKQKIEKLEEEEDQSIRDEKQAGEEEEEAEAEKDQFPPDEQEDSSLQTGQQSALHPKDQRSHTHKQLLKPQTAYKKRAPHRQKSTSEVKPCMCQIM